MRVLIGFLMAGILACSVATPAAAETVCVHFDDYCSNTTSFCHYAETTKSVFLAWRPGSLRLKPIPPAVVLPPRPTKITSCEAVSKEPPRGYCEATICGPTNPSLRDGVTPFKDVTTAPPKSAAIPCGGAGNPCRQKPLRAGPGLLDGDSGFAQQGPAAAGAPVQTNSGGRSQ
jgi:hypothetical protein